MGKSNLQRRLIIMGHAKNVNVKKANQQHEYTPEQVRELGLCVEDPIYFIKKYVMIKHPVRGSIPFDMYLYQERMIKAFMENKFCVALASRQVGKSITAAAYILWFSIFHFDKTILIASNKNKNAMLMIRHIQFAYENLPMWIKPGVTEIGWNRHSVEFDNGSRIESTATTEDAGRSMSISLLYCDEFAFVKPNIQEEFWTSIEPTLSTGGSCIMTSTPNGDINIFAQIWRGALVGANGFFPIEVTWNEPPNRDQKFKEDTIAKIGERKWLQEYDCQFLSSDALLVDSLTLINLTNTIKNIKPAFEIRDVIFWKEPLPNHTYLIGVDPSTGSGKDFSAIEVYEFPSMEQVAEYRSNSVSSTSIYQVLRNILFYFEKKESAVYFSVENNGVGEGIISLFEADEHPPLTAEFVSETGKERRGITTTAKSKMRCCLSLKEMIEKGTIGIKSTIMLQEIKEFVRKRGAYEARRGSTDDSVAATLVAIRLMEEISTYDQDAYNKLFSQEYNEWSEGEYNDTSDPDPMVF